MIEGRTKSGIEFKLNEKVKDDTRFLYYLQKIKNTDLDNDERSRSVYDLLGVIFGNEGGMVNFMNAVANVHDGVCDTDALMTELNEMFSAVGLKNS